MFSKDDESLVSVNSVQDSELSSADIQINKIEEYAVESDGDEFMN